MPTPTHAIAHNGTIIPLTPEEARVIIRGEIPRGLATILKRRGLTLPPRGPMRYTLLVLPDQIINTEAHMRRLPDPV